MAHAEYKAKRAAWMRERLNSNPAAKTIARARAKTWQRQNRDRIKAYNRAAKLLKTHGLSVADFDRIFSLQRGRCGICGVKESAGKGFHVDHDHATGKIRGILCHHCNLLLGHAQDKIDVLTSAIEYLTFGGSAACSVVLGVRGNAA